jgi:hypothetical protein
MATTWGGLTLNVMAYKRDDVKQMESENDMVIIQGITASQSRSISTGRGRYRREIKGWATKADFDLIELDYELSTKKIAVFQDGTSSTTAILEKLDGERQLGNDKVFYDVTVLEV